LGWGRRIALDPNPEALHRPSADELFASLSLRAGTAGVGVLLTGMGSDGAEGLLALRRKGGHTIVQDEHTSAVYGMPAAAAKLNAAVRDPSSPSDRSGRAAGGRPCPLSFAPEGRPR